MPGVIVDGADVIACYLAAREAVERALVGDGPTLIEAKVTRLTGHSSDDQQTKYRSEAELAEERARDPIPRFRDELRWAGLLDEGAEAAIAAEIAALVDDATDYAERAPDPDPATLGLHVYAEPGDPVPGPPPASIRDPGPGDPAGADTQPALALDATTGPPLAGSGPGGDAGRNESTRSADERTPGATDGSTSDADRPTGASDANGRGGAPPTSPPVPGPA
jgi:hypothetical protein